MDRTLIKKYIDNHRRVVTIRILHKNLLLFLSVFAYCSLFIASFCYCSSFWRTFSAHMGAFWAASAAWRTHSSGVVSGCFSWYSHASRAMHA